MDKLVVSQIFPDVNVCETVRRLAELMQYANSREDGRWSWQSTNPDHNGVYGAAYQTIQAIIREYHGQAIMDRASELLNIGGSGSWFYDVCWAVHEALEEQREQRRLQQVTEAFNQSPVVDPTGYEAIRQYVAPRAHGAIVPHVLVTCERFTYEGWQDVLVLYHGPDGQWRNVAPALLPMLNSDLIEEAEPFQLSEKNGHCYLQVLSGESFTLADFAGYIQDLLPDSLPVVDYDTAWEDSAQKHP